MWENTVQRDRPQMTIWSMRIACWIPKYVILITFPIQQWEQEGASVSRNRYSTVLVTNKSFQKRQFHFKARDEAKHFFARDRCQTVSGAF